MPVSSYVGHHVINSLVPILAHTTADATGLAVAVGGYQDVQMVWNQGVALDTLGGALYWTITFEECAVTTAGSFTLIAAGDIEGGGATVLIDAAAEDPTLLVRRYKGKLAYVRMIATKTGTHTNGTPLCAFVVLSGAVHVPVTVETELGTAT